MSDAEAELHKLLGGCLAATLMAPELALVAAHWYWPRRNHA